MKRYDLLFTADRNYVQRIPVVLCSMFAADPDTAYRIHLIHDDLDSDDEIRFQEMCQKYGYEGCTYRLDDKVLKNAPVNKHYVPAMYYRLLAATILPHDLDKILYLDPDLLILGSVRPLFETDMGDAIFLAASHTPERKIMDNINRIRLNTNAPYYNTGVMVIDLERARECVKQTDIYQFIQKHGNALLLPDQDVFNALYSHLTRSVPDEIWNYDARRYSQYFLRSNGVYNGGWIMSHTAILHFCGQKKPWMEGYQYRFGYLYLHYEQLSKRRLLG